MPINRAVAVVLYMVNYSQNNHLTNSEKYLYKLFVTDKQLENVSRCAASVSA